MPVFARTPQFKHLAIPQQLFDVALVVHVDLSVLVWFFAIICMGAVQLMERFPGRWLYWQSTGFWCIAASTVLMALPSSQARELAPVPVVAPAVPAPTTTAVAVVVAAVAVPARVAAAAEAKP